MAKEQDISTEIVQKMRIIDQLMPAIDLVVNKDISLEEFAKEVAPLAAMRMAALVLSQDPNIAFKASQEILNRELGKPMERRAVLTADVKDLNERQLNNEILRYLRDDAALLDQAQPSKSKPKTSLPKVKKVVTLNVDKEDISE
jgi:hypothetical protein